MSIKHLQAAQVHRSSQARASNIGHAPDFRPRVRWQPERVVVFNLTYVMYSCELACLEPSTSLGARQVVLPSLHTAFEGRLYF